MSNTYSQIYVQVVFAVQFRKALIQDSWKKLLYAYIIAMVSNRKCKVLVINGVEDHIHILIGLDPEISLSMLVKEIKQASSKWINQNVFGGKSVFRWQSGFAAFSYSRTGLDAVANYIRNQEEHHRETSLRQEQIRFLTAFNVDYDDKYIFKEPE
jgi:REP element-mobilizing transposase RayT